MSLKPPNFRPSLSSVALCVSLLCLGFAAAELVTVDGVARFPITTMTYVDSTSPATAIGASSPLNFNVQFTDTGSSTTIMRTYIEIDINSECSQHVERLPATTTIHSATMYYRIILTDGSPFFVTHMRSPTTCSSTPFWEEDTLTWDNQPVFSTVDLTTTGPTNPPDVSGFTGLKALNLTDIARESLVNQSGIIQLRLWSNSTINLSGYSRFDDDHAPYILVDYSYTEDVPKKESLPMAVQYLFILVLVCMSGLFSGLTLGLMGLDVNGLKIIISSGSENDRKYAKKIFPLRQRGNLLLCTLLLGNVAVNSLLSIIMADITSGLVGFLASTGVIVIFGEILPQAVLSRHPLWFGSKTVPLVKVFLVLLYPLSYPISAALDKLLGAEIGTFYSRTELKQLLELHREQSAIEGGEAHILSGVLDFKEKVVGSIMTPASDLFMLNSSDRLDYDTLTSIWERGYSRVPVFAGNKNHIIGLLFVKDLVLINPDDAIPVKTMISFYGSEVMRVFPDELLNDMLNRFKTGKSHMAIVHRVNNEGDGDPFYETIGLITLEDVIEEMIQDEIQDETDEPASGGSGNLHTRRSISHISLSPRGTRLPPQMASAVDSFLTQSVGPFRLFGVANDDSHILRQFLSVCTIEEYVMPDIPPNSDADPQTVAPHVYTKGQSVDYFTLIIKGKFMLVNIGDDNLEMEVGAWTPLGVRALEGGASFSPDFTCVLKSPTGRVLKIPRKTYEKLCKSVADGDSKPGFDDYPVRPHAERISIDEDPTTPGPPVIPPVRNDSITLDMNSNLLASPKDDVDSA